MKKSNTPSPSLLVKIDCDIPLPDSGTSGLTANLRRLTMVGQSFFWKPKSRASIGASAKQVGIKIATRAEGDGFRIWRKE